MIIGSMSLEKSNAKVLSGEIILLHKATLIWKISDFNRHQHQITYCEIDTPKMKYPCLIDGKKWYGYDFPNELPKIEFKSLQLKLDNQLIHLNTSMMFNPVYALVDLNSIQFRLKKFSDHHILYAFFADGAATYTVHWRIKNGESEILKISRDDADFSWQFE